MAALTGFRKLESQSWTRTSPEETKARDELKETPAGREHCLNRLRQLIRAHPEFHFRTDSEFLLRFLRARKFDTDRAFLLLRRYYEARSRDPEVFGELLPSALEHVFAHNLHGVLPDRDPQGRAVMVARIGLGDPSKFPLEDGLRAALLCLEKAIDDVPTQVHGIVAIVDMAGLGVAKLRHLIAPVNVYRLVNLAQEAFPARFKAAHIVNESTVFDICYTLLKPLLSEKNKQRLFVHGSDMSSLHQYLPASILPEEFGGDLGPYDNSEWRQCLREAEPTFARDLTFGIQTNTDSKSLNKNEVETSSL